MVILIFFYFRFRRKIEAESLGEIGLTKPTGRGGMSSYIKFSLLVFTPAYMLFTMILVTYMFMPSHFQAEITPYYAVMVCGFVTYLAVFLYLSWSYIASRRWLAYRIYTLSDEMFDGRIPFSIEAQLDLHEYLRKVRPWLFEKGRSEVIER
jgi:hypothetical protein